MKGDQSQESTQAKLVNTDFEEKISSWGNRKTFFGKQDPSRWQWYLNIKVRFGLERLTQISPYPNKRTKSRKSKSSNPIVFLPWFAFNDMLPNHITDQAKAGRCNNLNL